MDLKLINDRARAVPRRSRPPTRCSDVTTTNRSVHQIVIAYQANARLGTRARRRGAATFATRTRSPGARRARARARSGDVASPLWRGGGKIFPNLPDENFSHKVNRKMYRAGMCSILSQLAREERLKVVESFSVEAPKTKLLSQKLKNMGLASTLVITDSIDQNLALSSRNLVNVRVLDVDHADPVSLIQFDNVILTQEGSGALRGDLLK